MQITPLLNLCVANPIFQTYVANGVIKNTPGKIRLLDEIETKFQRLPPLSMTAIPMELPVSLPNKTGSAKSNGF